MRRHLHRSFVLLAVLALAAACDRRIDVDFNYAVEQKDYEWAGRLLERGADIDARFIQADGYTTLMMAVKGETNPEGVRWLLDHGAAIDRTAFNGRTALHVAANEGRPRHVEILLAAGAKVNARNRRGETARRLARNKGHAEVDRLLAEAGGTH
jgi:ankyrin repeat protein